MRVYETHKEVIDGREFIVSVGGSVKAKGRARRKGQRARRRPYYVPRKGGDD